MPRNFKAAAGVPVQWRIALGVLLLATIGAAWIVMSPPGGSAEDLQRNMRQAVGTDRIGAGRREVDDPAIDERPAIVDPHHHPVAGEVIGHPHQRAKRQGAMGGGE